MLITQTEWEELDEALKMDFVPHDVPLDVTGSMEQRSRIYQSISNPRQMIRVGIRSLRFPIDTIVDLVNSEASRDRTI